jgi:hypothetical protein
VLCAVQNETELRDILEFSSYLIYIYIYIYICIYFLLKIRTFRFAKVEVPTRVLMKIQVVWNITTCLSINTCRRTRKFF